MISGLHWRTAAKASTWCSSIGLLANSTRGLGRLNVKGRSLVPYPPTRISAFILSLCAAGWKWKELRIITWTGPIKWGLKKMISILQTTFSNGNSWSPKLYQAIVYNESGTKNSSVTWAESEDRNFHKKESCIMKWRMFSTENKDFATLQTRDAMMTQNWVNIWSGNSLLPDSNKPLPKPMLTNHQKCLVAFRYDQFHRKCLRYLPLLWVWKLLIWYNSYVSQGPMS